MTRVQLHIRAERLGNIARGRWYGKKTNPYATVTYSGISGSASGAEEVGSTEIIRNSLSPNWATIFIIEHNENQAWTPITITLKDSRASSAARSSSHGNRTSIRNNLRTLTNSVPSSFYGRNDPMMGEVRVEVGEILGLEGQEVKLDLDEGGCVYVHITESTEKQSTPACRELTAGQFRCHIRGLDLENIEKGIMGLGAIDPYFELSKKYTHPISGIKQWLCVYRSEHIPNIINPYWRPFAMDMEKLCNGNLKKELMISVWDYGSKKSRWLGEYEVNVDWLMKSVTKGGNASREDALPINNEEMEEVGLLVVLKADVVPV